MIIDCSTATDQGRIDVTRYRRLSIQANPALGNPSSAVVEVKRAFGPSGPSVSFDATQTLTLDGSAILDIDVTDTAFVAIVVTTAQSGVTSELGYRLTGEIRGQAGKITIDLSETVRAGYIGTLGYGHRSFLLADPHTAIDSGVARIDRVIGDGPASAPVVPDTNLTFDGATITEVDCSGADALVMAVETIESGESSDVYWYTREEVESDRTGNAFVATITSNTGTITSTASDIPWASTVLSQGISYSRSGAEITFEEPGVYAIHCDVSVVVTSESNRAHYEITTLIDTGSGYSSVNGPRCSIYARLNDNGKYYSGTINWVHVAAAGDKLKFQAESYGEIRDGEYEGGACALSIIKIG